MKDSLGFIVLFVVLVVFGLWQMNRANEAEAENAVKQTRLDVQAETIKTLEKLGERIDKALEARRGEGETIAQEREQTRKNTRAASRRDPTLQEQLDTPLHPALRPRGGLLGRDNGQRADGPGGAAHADKGP